MGVEISMKLTCISSESLGNGYILESSDDILLLEAGIKLSIVKQYLNYDLSKVRGVCLTHGHL